MQSRATAIDLLYKALKDVSRPQNLVESLPDFVKFLVGLIADPNFKIAISSMSILGELASKVGSELEAHLRSVRVWTWRMEVCKQGKGQGEGKGGLEGRVLGGCVPSLYPPHPTSTPNPCLFQTITSPRSVVVPALLEKFTDSKILVRAANMKAIKKLMGATSPGGVLELLALGSSHTSWRVREEVLNTHIMVGTVGVGEERWEGRGGEGKRMAAGRGVVY